MDKEARQRYTDQLRKNQSAEFNQHILELRALEEELGFNLDVATDIYGGALLDPKKGGEIAEKWESLLEALSDEPDNTLLLVREVMVPNPPHRPRHFFDTPRLEFALVQGVNDGSVLYTPKDLATDTAPSITVVGTAAPIVDKVPHQDRYGEEVAIDPSGALLLALGKREAHFSLSPTFNLTDRDVTIFVNPSYEKLWSQLSDQYRAFLEFPPEIREILKQKDAKV